MSEQQNHPEEIIHIGLHKTGTRFLQGEVFQQLDSNEFSVNPEPLWSKLRAAVRGPGDRAAAEAAREAVNNWRNSGDNRKLVLSEPHISGDMYSCHFDYYQNLQLIKQLFPDAVILFFVRNQADWLHSAYRQQLVRSPGIPINVFLNHYEGEFKPRLNRRVFGARNLEALNLRFLAIYRQYAAAYGASRVYLFRQEDLKNSSELVKKRIAEALGISSLPFPPKDKTKNRSYSALAISLFFPRSNKDFPKPTEKDIGPKQKRFKKISKPLKQFRHNFIQYVFDKIMYWDWDLLARGKMREKIDAHYAEENNELKRISRIILEQGPEALESDYNSNSN